MDISCTSSSAANEDSGSNTKKTKNSTSTPFNDGNKIKATVAFDFISPPNCNSIIQGQLIDSQVIEQNQRCSYYELRQRNRRATLNENQKIDDELKAKEGYLKQLRSIDLSKYSFPNENKPKTDYTYAHSGIYLSHKMQDDPLDDTPLEIPNLCRRARKVTPQNSILKDSRCDSKESFFHKINIFRYFYSFFSRKNTANADNNGNKNYVLKNLYGLDRNTSDIYGSQNSSSQYIPSNGSQRKNKKRGCFKLFILFLIFCLASLFSYLYKDKLNEFVPSINYDHEYVKNLITQNVNNLKNGFSETIESLQNKIPDVDKVKNELTKNFEDKLNSTLTALFSKLQSEQESELKNSKHSCEQLNGTLLSLMEKFNNLKLERDQLNITLQTFIEKFNDLKSERDQLDVTFLSSSEKFNNLKFERDQLNETLSSFLEKFNNLKFERDQLNATLSELMKKFNEQNFQQSESQSSCVEKQKQIEENIEELEKKLATLKDLPNKESLSESNTQDISNMIQYKIEDIVKKTLYVYNADKTGMTDFASESLGGNILFTRCTETYTEKTRWITVLNYPIFQVNSSPRIIIQNLIHPGNCWAFKGHKGDVFIKLAAAIKPKSFSIEHIAKELTPSHSLDTAPQKFAVYGYTDIAETDSYDGVLLGEYTYDNASNDIIQFFNVQTETDKKISIIELKIETNGGNKDYTCIYKFRVHGDMIVNNEPTN